MERIRGTSYTHWWSFCLWPPSPFLPVSLLQLSVRLFSLGAQPLRMPVKARFFQDLGSGSAELVADRKPLENLKALTRKTPNDEQRGPVVVVATGLPAFGKGEHHGKVWPPLHDDRLSLEFYAIFVGLSLDLGWLFGAVWRCRPKGSEKKSEMGLTGEIRGGGRGQGERPLGNQCQ